MAWLKSNPLFAALLLACATAGLMQGWLIYTTRERALRAAIQLEVRRGERDWLARQSPALSEENSRAIAAEVAAAEKRLAELRAHLAGKPWLPAAPVRSVDAYFALASFNEKMRALAVGAQIALRAEERFGFSSYTNEGPDADLIASVHRQRVVMQHALEALFEARPKALVAAMRERPLTEAQRSARRAAITGASAAGGADAAAAASLPVTRPAEQSADLFEPDSRLRLHAPGLVDGELYRVEFTGQTQTLRAFLNALVALPLPLFVRAVEVEPDAIAPVAADASTRLAPLPSASSPVPLVARNFSKFVVVFECIEIAPPAPGLATLSP
jgi:hypothetical protein